MPLVSSMLCFWDDARTVGLVQCVRPQDTDAAIGSTVAIYCLIGFFAVVLPVALVARFMGARWAKAFFVVLGCIMIPPLGVFMIGLKIEESHAKAKTRQNVALSNYPGDARYREMMAKSR